MWDLKEKMMWDSIVPFVAMFLLEGVTIALTITANVAMGYGMNQFVFVAYSNAISVAILVPYSFFFHRQSIKDSMKLKLIARFFLLGFIGITIGQNVAFTGLLYSSPIVVCAMGLLLPCFQFFLALFQGQTKVELRRASCKARVIGIIISFMGAAMVISYQGPSIIPSTYFKPLLLLHGPSPPTFYSLFGTLTTSHQWIFGCLLLACATFFNSISGVVQVGAYRKLPDMMVIVTWYIFLGTVQTAVVDLIAERDLSAWELSLNLELTIIILTALLGTFGRSKIQGWCMNKKGAMYVARFKPFGIFWACAITIPLFGTTLHYGSVAGATISGAGYYGMLWAATKEEEEKKAEQTDIINSTDSLDDHLKTPLLHNQQEEQV
ncbi:hypothetical protein V2J09_003741 [Rumex salicifolius]